MAESDSIPGRVEGGKREGKKVPPDAYIDNSAGRAYWEGIEASVDGMLGGFANVSRVDLTGSREFLAKLGVGGRNGRRLGRVLEGGAGIGRVTRGLLIPLATTVDVVEPVAKFTADLAQTDGVGRVFNVGLEQWRPDDGVVYDLIWTQWCIGHLNDEQLVAYLLRCTAVLEREKGFIVVKENMSTVGEDLFDAEDSSVTREDGKFCQLFEQANLQIISTELQSDYPPELFPVRSYALRPK